MIKGIIFDKDGTLFDFNATWGAWTRGMLQSEAAGDDALLHALADAMGFDLATGLFKPESIVIAATVDETADAMLTVLPNEGKDALISRMKVAATQVEQVEVTPLVAYFDQLRDFDLFLGIATNDAEAPARAHLDRAGVVQHFDFIAGYDSGYGGKPAPGQLHGFCAEIGLDPAQCVMVGDSTHDLHAGQAAGMRTVGVLTGPAPFAELAPFADIVLPDISAIPEWLTSENLLDR